MQFYYLFSLKSSVAAIMGHSFFLPSLPTSLNTGLQAIILSNSVPTACEDYQCLFYKWKLQNMETEVVWKIPILVFYILTVKWTTGVKKPSKEQNRSPYLRLCIPMHN